MSFILKRIELNNIRIHEKFVFEPVELGITAISGENGSGKSTIVDSLAWCLYGTRVNNMRNKTLIRDGVNPKDTPVNVKVTILAGGIEYFIERKILNESGQTECNVWGKLENEDELSLIAGPAVSHVEAFIRQTLNMNEKGFLTSVLIQQKQVDQIVSASPRERGEVIEKLTGIASITQAISMANEENRTLQKAALLIQTGNLEEAELKVSQQKEHFDKLAQKEVELGKKFVKLKEDFTKSKELLKVARANRLRADSLISEMNTLVEKNSFLQGQSNNDLELVSKYKKKYGTLTVVDLDSLKSARTAKQSRLNKINNKIEVNNIKLKGLKGKEVNLSNEKSLSDLSDEELLVSEKLANAKLENEAIDTRRRIALADLERAKSSLSNFSESDKHCPVCKHEIDNPLELKVELHREIETLTSTSSTLKKDLSGINKTIKGLEVELKELSERIEALKEHDKLLSEIKEVEDENTELTSLFLIAEQELKAADREYEMNIKISADQNALEAAKERSLKTSLEIAKNNEKIEELKEEIELLDIISVAKLEKLERDTQALSSELTKRSIAGKELQATKNLAKERLGDYEENLSRVKETLERYNQIAERIKVLTSSISVMTEFKRSRIEYSIPTLEFYASDILTKFTGGKFAKLSLDEKFNTTVTTSTGAIRPIAQLSGGELSSAAIALRLGIALLLNSNERNALIFDEVLVSMDEDRARQIMETVSSITNCQVIFIAHNTDINSVADKVVHVASTQEVEDVE